MTRKPLFDSNFLNDLATDIWSSARLHAEETSNSGEKLNSAKHVARIRRQLQTAAGTVATDLLDRQEDLRALRERIGSLNAEVKATKAVLKETQTSLRELENKTGVKAEKVSKVKTKKSGEADKPGDEYETITPEQMEALEKKLKETKQ
jgi:hypothetical protein